MDDELFPEREMEVLRMSDGAQTALGFKFKLRQLQDNQNQQLLHGLSLYSMIPPVLKLTDPLPL